jgi:hypothetical protein
VSHFQPVFVKPSFTQPVSIWLYLTNNVGWSYQVVRSHGKPLTPTYVTGTTGWTNIVERITNSVPASAQYRVWVTSYSTNLTGIAASGWSWVHVPTESSATFMQ